MSERTLREYLIGCAVTGVLAQGKVTDAVNVAKKAVGYADAVMDLLREEAPAAPTTDKDHGEAKG
jgi:hypothetical protein